MMNSIKLARSSLVRQQAGVISASVRSFTGNVSKLDDKEKGDERIFFKRQEGKPLIQYHSSWHYFALHILFTPFMFRGKIEETSGLTQEGRQDRRRPHPRWHRTLPTNTYCHFQGIQAWQRGKQGPLRNSHRVETHPVKREPSPSNIKDIPLCRIERLALKQRVPNFDRGKSRASNTEKMMFPFEYFAKWEEVKQIRPKWIQLLHMSSMEYNFFLRVNLICLGLEICFEAQAWSLSLAETLNYNSLNI